MKPVLPGTDGGVSPLGMTASVVASGSVSLFVGASWIVIAAGIAGSIIDSLLGVIQRKKVILSGGELVHIGWRWLTNDSVNLLSQIIVIGGMILLLGPLW
jgi:uncharacterized membrane protein